MGVDNNELSFHVRRNNNEGVGFKSIPIISGAPPAKCFVLLAGRIFTAGSRGCKECL